MVLPCQIASACDELREVVDALRNGKGRRGPGYVVAVHQADLLGTFLLAELVVHEIGGLGVVVEDAGVVEFRQNTPAGGI